jgi:hypothetical protein
MKRSWLLMIAGFALMLGLASEAQCQANPPKGRFSIELGFTSKGLLLKFGAGPAMPDMPATIDTICPNIVPAYLDSLVTRMRSAFTPAAGMQAALPHLEREQQSAQLFEVGEIYRRTGQFSSARTYYQRVHQTAPTSRLGALAMERLAELEERLRDAGEESGNDEPEAHFQNIRERTIPLGLAQLPTY